jgi:hypothetical protein
MDGDGDNNASTRPGTGSLESRSKLRKRGTRSSSNHSVSADVVVCYLIFMIQLTAWVIEDKSISVVVCCRASIIVVWTSLGPLPRWVPGPTTRWAPGTTRLVLHGT